MRCPNCSHENRSGARFCENCGTKLESICPNCKTTNRPGAKFCDNCGTRLSDEAPSPPAPPQPIPAQPIPGELADKLTTARLTRAMLGERRVVTMLFCDVTGSTALAEKLDPEEWREIINGAFEHMIAPIYRYEGTLARLMGDAILAFFGAPIAHEDDPQRAVLAGLEIVQGIAPYWDQVEARWGSRLNVRVGINTGLVVVGAVGSDLKMEYTALGDAINLASRMEQTAEPGTVQVSENTHRLTAPLFEWEALGEQVIRGRAEPVRVYRPTRKLDAPGRLRGIEGLSAPLIGREVEFRKIAGLLETARLGRGGAVFITGEAGLGKTRLLREARQAWEAGDAARGRPPHWIERRATSYDALQAYSLVKGLLRAICGIGEMPEPEQIETRVDACFSGSGMGDPRLTGLAEVVIRLLAPTSDEPGAAQESFKAQLFDGLEYFLQTRYADQTGVFIVDDLQWADPASIELLTHLAPLVEKSSLVFIFTARPDRDSPGWAFKTGVANRLPHRFLEVSLEPLADEDGARLIDSLLPAHDLPDDLRRRIGTRAEGNPYFVEEILRDFIESGLLRQQDGRWQIDRKREQVEVPDTVEALLTARLDRLSAPARDLLQLAAVIGRSFSYRILKSVSSGSASQDEFVAELERAQLIEETARQPELEYSFRQALTQELVYQSILRSRRKVFHAQVGHAIEAQHAGQLRDYAPMLAFHFEEAGESERAIRYHRMAGDSASALFANTEAIQHYRRVIELDHAARPEAELVAIGELKEVYLRMGRALELASRFEEANEHYLAMEAWGENSGYKQIVLWAMVSQGVLRCTPTVLYNEEIGKPLVEGALKLARTSGDLEAEARCLWLMMAVERFKGSINDGIKFAQQGLAIAEEHGFVELIGYLNHDLAYAYVEIGLLHKSIESFAKAAEIWQELGNLPMLADGLSGNILNLAFLGEYERAMRDAERAYEISKRIHNLWGISYSRMNVGMILRDLGHYEAAIEAGLAAIRDGNAAGFMAPAPLCGIQLVAIYLDLGDVESAEKQAEQVGQAAAATPVPEMKLIGQAATIAVLIAHGEVQEALDMYHQHLAGSILSQIFLWYYSDNIDIKGELLLGNYEKAFDTCEKLLAELEGFGLTGLLADLHYLKARCLAEMDRPAEAGMALEKAQTTAEKINQRRHLWRIYDARANLDEQSGNSQQAADFRRASAEVIAYIADHTPPDLREKFLAQGEVRRIVEKANG